MSDSIIVSVHRSAQVPNSGHWIMENPEVTRDLTARATSPADSGAMAIGDSSRSCVIRS